MLKPVIFTVAALAFFGFAVAFLFFSNCELAKYAVAHIHRGIPSMRATHFGLGLVGAGLALLAFGWKDAWQG